MKITFKQFIKKNTLLEGGNVSINGEYADEIDLNKFDRNEVVKTIKKSLVKLNAAFKTEQGLYLWKPSVLEEGKIFSGSARHLFNGELETTKLTKHKSKFGDIDLMIDIELKPQFEEFINHHKFKHFEHFTVIGSKPTGDQVICLFKVDNLNINIQVDFEGVEFKNGKPSEWAHFSHSSPFEDMANGIKGAFHKLLLTSLMAPKKVEAIEQMKTKQKDIIASTHVLSIKGMREKYKKINEKDGKPVVVDTESEDFITDFNEIFKEVFDKTATETDIKKIWSYKGLLELIKKYMDEYDRKKVIDSFTEKLFGEGAQLMYRGDGNRDLEEKTTALEFMEDKLDVTIQDHKLEDMQTQFYKRQK
jgi:hypothetical protein